MDPRITLVAKHSGKILTYLDSHEFIAKRDTKCLRKGVACSVLLLKEIDGELPRIVMCVNGPVEHFHCRNIVGGCGCIHSEQKAILFLAIQGFLRKEQSHLLLCTYSPCTNCANLIIISGFKGIIVFKYLTEHDPDGITNLIANDIPTIPFSDLEQIDNAEAD